MKKVLKSLSLAFVFLALAVVPLLVGCSKTYTVTVSVTGGNQNGGFVTYRGGISVYGKTAVDEGEDFVFTISPKDGYYIHEIKIDNKVYDKSFNKNGYTLTLEKVSSNREVNVTFAPTNGYEITLYCCEYNEGGQNTGLVKYKTYNVLYAEKLDLSEFGDNIDDVFYYNRKADNQNIFIDTTEGIDIYGNINIFTLKSKADLDQMIADNAPAAQE